MNLTYPPHQHKRYPPGEEYVALPVKRFLAVELCPQAWLPLDLYRIHDAEVTFYIGQSHNAFERVWQHIHEGFKGRSQPGRFIILNWPVSMNFTIELICAGSARFASVDYDLNAAEALLIQQYTPCLNVVLNREPAALPARYLPPTARPERLPRLSRMVREAELNVEAEEKRRWLHEMAENESS